MTLVYQFRGRSCTKRKEKKKGERGVEVKEKYYNINKRYLRIIYRFLNRRILLRVDVTVRRHPVISSVLTVYP